MHMRNGEMGKRNSRPGGQAGIANRWLSRNKNTYHSHSLSEPTERVMAFCLPNAASLKTMEAAKKQKDFP